MSIIEKLLYLFEEESLSIHDRDASVLLELNLGEFIKHGEMDTIFLSPEFALDPDDFIQDVAFLSLLAKDEEEKDYFQNLIYDMFSDYWSEVEMTKGEFFNNIESVTLDLLII